jgi:hypothetical protein
MATRLKVGGKDPFGDIQALKICLDELGDHAATNGLPLAATLIGAAARAIGDEILERKVQKQVSIKHEAPRYNA